MAGIAVPVLIVFWFTAAQAGMAIRRIVSGGNNGRFARRACSATDVYESPLILVAKNRPLRDANSRLADVLNDVLGAPDTTHEHNLIRVAVVSFSGVPHPHLLGDCCPDRLRVFSSGA